MTKEQFFEILQDSTYWDVAVSINRTNPLPLDRFSVFNSLSEAQDYLNNPVAYPGQVIAVLGEQSADVYVIKNSDSGYELKLLASGGDTEDLKARVLALENWQTEELTKIDCGDLDEEEA